MVSGKYDAYIHGFWQIRFLKKGMLLIHLYVIISLWAVSEHFFKTFLSHNYVLYYMYAGLKLPSGSNRMG